MRNKTTWLVVALFSICLFGISALSQTINGTISGSVTDSAGAVVPGANVTVKNAATGFTRTATTDSDGGFRISGLPVASYSVRIEKGGYKTSVNGDVVASVGGNTGIRIMLEAGSVEAVVQVTS